MSTEDNSAPTLSIYFSGIFAIVLKEWEGKPRRPQSARILLPHEGHRASKFTEHVMLPPHTTFVGIPTDLIEPEDLKRRPPAFCRETLVPVISIPGCEQQSPLVDMSYYYMGDGRISVDYTSLAKFKAVLTEIDPDDGLTCCNADSLEWVANMERYAAHRAEVDPAFLHETMPPEAPTAYFDVKHGRLSVASIDPDHDYYFIDCTSENYHQPLADSVKVVAELDRDSWVRIRIDGRWLKLKRCPNTILMFASASIEEVAKPGAHHCGEPLYHHEVLYRFSKRGASDAFLPMPVCLDLQPDRARIPGLGGCIPPSKMTTTTTTPSATAMEGLTAESSSRTKGASLHIGVCRYSLNFANATGAQPPDLRSCGADANALLALAKARGFQASSLNDENVNRDDLEAAFKQCATDIGDGGYFIVTYAGHGLPLNVGKGWCLFSEALPFNDLRAMLTNAFPSSTRILVISDACHSGGVTLDSALAGFARVVPAETAARLQKSDWGGWESQDGPVIYFVSACSDAETTPDGLTFDTPSKFTSGVCAAAQQSPSDFDSFRARLLTNAHPRHPDLNRSRDDSEFDKLGPFRLPS